MKRARDLFHIPIGDGDTPVLARMFSRRFDDEGLDKPARSCGIIIETPAVGAVAQSERPDGTHGRDKILGARRGENILRA